MHHFIESERPLLSRFLISKVLLRRNNFLCSLVEDCIEVR